MPIEPFRLIKGGQFVCTPAWSNRAGNVDDFHRLYFPISGHAQLWADDQEVKIRPGSVYLIPGRRRISHVCRSAMQVNWLHFRACDLVDQALLDRMDAVHIWPAHDWDYWIDTYQQLDQLFAEHPLKLVTATEAMLMDQVGQLLVEYRLSSIRMIP
ncbi:MAG: hypothetical protein JKX85_08550 [Phycisphaeraceae bacterium]|nr:hypothetical protein [Phycisphaeraceae bacterium]